MSKHTSLGEWSDSEEDDLIRNIDEETILRGVYGNDYRPRGTEEWDNSEDDELIRNINEDEILPCINDDHTGRGEKRKTLSEDEPAKKRKNAVLNEDDDHTPAITVEESNNEDEINISEESDQTGQGKKRKAETQGMEQEEYYRIQTVKERYAPKFKTTGKNYRVQFNNTLDNVDLLESQTRTYDIFDHLIQDVTKGMNPTDQVRFILDSKQLQHPITLPFCALEELTTEKVLSQVEKVVQSNEEFRLNDAVNIDILRVEMPQGSGRSRRTTFNLRQYLKKKQSVICINNNDNYCLARALAVSIARIEKDPRYKHIAKPSRSLQRERAINLHRAAGVPFDIPCGLKEVDLFQQHLTQYQIIVVSGDQNNTIIYPPQPPANPNPEKSIYLYYQTNHFDVITTLPGFLNTNYFCHRCHKGYDHTTDHLCEGMCKACRGVGCIMENHGIICKECDRLFKNQTCYDRHKQEPVNGGGRTMCETVRKCPTCKKSIRVTKLKNHLCIDIDTCATCKVKRNPNDPNHKCYMQQEKVKEEPSYAQLLFFDFECNQERGIHEVNLCVVYDEEGEAKVFRGKNTVNDFCTWLFTPEHDKSIVIAHNFQGYDSYFILKHLDQEAIPYEVIYNGAKCMTLTTKRKGKKQFAVEIKFIDSLNFIPMPLAKFPKTFGLDELCKGYFPHYFNKDENQDYVGPIPCQEDYGANTMKPEAREKFLTWHQEQVENNYVFDFQKEILAYCSSDVDIMAESCKLYREMFIQATDTTHDDTGLDPFDKSVTIAAYCMHVYRTKFLKKDTIGLFPQHEELKRKQSHEALQWLSYTADKEGIHIQHHRNGGEKRVGPYSLDGYCEETHTVYEYQGCYWHGKNLCIQQYTWPCVKTFFFLGCPECYPKRDVMNRGNNKPMEELYKNTQKKIKWLKDQGFEVVEKWGCVFKKDMEQDEGLKQFVKDRGFVDPLQPRDAFFGGRTNAAKLLHECQGDEKIK